MSRTECIGRRDDASHLFVCPACRAEARMALAWKGLRLSEPPAAVDEQFVARVLAGAARDRSVRRRGRLLAAAAAVALFSFFAGLAHERVVGQAAPAVEESYAALAAPGAFDGLIPN